MGGHREEPPMRDVAANRQPLWPVNEQRETKVSLRNLRSSIAFPCHREEPPMRDVAIAGIPAMASSLRFSQ